MKAAKRGRPKGAARIQREDIIRAVLEILDKSGPEGLSMRKVAEHLKVTPMALYHHVADRSEMLRGASDLVYSEVLIAFERSTGSVRQRIEKLLMSYHKAVLRHPHLTLSIFADPNAFSLEAKRITQKILDLLAEADLAAAERKQWLNILVDFTHGSSIATAMNSLSPDSTKSPMPDPSTEYARGLRKLLDCIFA